jgi:hypothetical protein
VCFAAMRKKPVNSTFNHSQSGHSRKVFISRKNRKSRFNGQSCDPNIVDRNHRATLLEIKVNPGIDRRSNSRNMKHRSVAKKISNTCPSRVPLIGLQDPETEFGKSNNVMAKFLPLTFVSKRGSPRSKPMIALVSAMKSIRPPFMESVQRHRRSASRTHSNLPASFPL